MPRPRRTLSTYMAGPPFPHLETLPLDFSGDFVRVSPSASLLLLLRDVFPSQGN